MPQPTPVLLISTILLATLFILPAAAQLDSSQLDDDGCPPASVIVYSPFEPWWRFYNGTSQMCWNTASCLFIKADEARKQQFAATALVMGLIPLTLKDIAWPERRSVPVSRRLNVVVETVVLGLGLVPVVVDAKKGEDARAAATRNSRFAQWAWELRRRTVVALVACTAVWLLVCYAALAVVEVYSKRAALGCPFPVFALVWYVAGFVPGAIHAGLSRVRQRWMRDWEKRDERRRQGQRGHSDAEEMVAFVANARPGDGAADPKNAGMQSLAAQSKEREEKSASAVQGADEWWVVQLVWTFYYTAGTLIFTSIMAVTVIELFVWVVVSFATTGASKLLAVFICLAFEGSPW
ncbi:hypothetical protein MPH_04018 [Macrophomina phaseolina MS6]|uniref:Uncharacterized protein n=1 Tax=Macrophomina phaseolina (strain MS6) TaxID=1126212 RepID=K2S8J4_MACPH|nr:hypothetical protein MPH_04018 [Macrophomina phaseolina MS6]